MRKQVQIALAVFSLVALGIVAWPILCKREPVYHGKRLSTWLADDDGSLQAEQDAQRAVVEAGTNAVPILLRMLRERDSPLKCKLMGIAQSQRFIKVRFTPAESRNAGAWVGFSTLGPSAAFAVRSLMEICDLGISKPSLRWTVTSLAAIGGPAKIATPTLLRATTNSDVIVRCQSLYALAHIHAEPDLAVPALMNGLNDPNGTVRFVACTSLASLGEEAKQAVPVLVSSLSDPDRDVQFHARRALRAIDAEAAARAGIK